MGAISLIVRKIPSLLAKAPKQVKALNEKALQGDVHAEQQVKQYLKSKGAKAHDAEAYFDYPRFKQDLPASSGKTKEALLVNRETISRAHFGHPEEDPYKAIDSIPQFRDYSPPTTSKEGYQEISYVLPRNLINPRIQDLIDHFNNPIGTHSRVDWTPLAEPPKTGSVLEIQSDAVNFMLREKRDFMSKLTPENLTLPSVVQSLKNDFKPFTANVDWATDTINRQLHTALNKKYERLDFVLRDPTMDETRAKGVKKWYETDYAGRVKKQAKRIGAKVEETRKVFESDIEQALIQYQKDGDFEPLANLVLDSATSSAFNEDLVAAYARTKGIAKEEIDLFGDLPDIIDTVADELNPKDYQNISHKLRVILPTGAAAMGITFPAFADEQNSGDSPDQSLPAKKQQDTTQDVTKAQEFIAQGAKVPDVLSVLAQKYDKQTANDIMYKAMQPKLESFRAQGAKEEDIQAVLSSIGISAPQPQPSPAVQDVAPVDPNAPVVSPALPVDSFGDPGASNRPVETIPFTQPEPNGMVGQIVNILTGSPAQDAPLMVTDAQGNEVPLPPAAGNTPSPDEAVNQVNALKAGYKEMALRLADVIETKVGMSPQHTQEVKQLKAASDQYKTKLLKDKGYDVTGVDESGAILIKHPVTGEVQPYETSVLSSIPYNWKETAGAITGVAAGSALAISTAPAALAGLAVGAIGAAAGRGMDVMTAAEDLGVKADTATLVSEMQQAGVTDITLAGLGVAGFASKQISKASLNATKSAWDKFVTGNREGAVKALLDANNMNEAKAIDQVKQWERLTGNQLLSDQANATGQIATAEDRNAVMRAVTETLPGNEGVVKAATSEATKAGAPLNAQIAKRAKDVIGEAEKLTNDNIDSVIQDRLGSYVAQTEQTFEDVKSLGLDAMKDSPYQFNFVTTALVPAMKAQAKGIHNGLLRKDFYDYLDQIRELSGESLGAVAPKVKGAPDVAAKTKLVDEALAKVTDAHTSALAAQKGLKDQAGVTRSELAALKTQRQALRGKQAAAKVRATTLKTKKARDRAIAEMATLAKDIAKVDRKVLKTQDTLAKHANNVKGATQDVAIAAKRLRDHKATPVAQATPEAPGVTPTAEANRSFENLLQLRRVINELRGDTRFKGFTTFDQMKKTIESIDVEIERAALTHMPEGQAWLNQWKAANQEYSNMKHLEKNVLYKTLTNPRINSDRAVQSIAQSMSYTDPSTFMQVMRRMGSSRASVEGAVMKHFMQKHAVGFEGGKQAINFPELAHELDKVGFTQKDTQDLKRTIKLFAETFKNDPHLLAATGGIPLPKFQQSLAVDPVSKAKYAIASVMFNAIRARIPFSNNAGRAALVNNMGKVLDNPLDSQAISAVTKALPKNPELETAFHVLAQEFKKSGTPEHYGKVPIYRVHKPGEFRKASATQLGEGMLYYTDGKVANEIAKHTNGKVKEVMQLQKRIAMPWDVEKLLGHTPSVAELADPEIQQLLRNKEFAGLAVNDKVLLFK